MATGQLLRAATAGGWQYRLMHGSNTVGLVDVVPDKTDEKILHFAGLYQTDFSSEVLEAARIAGELQQVKKQDYQLRRLDIPAINFVAVWLRGKSDDILMPLPPTFHRKLNAYQAYSEREIIKVLKPEAERVMKELNLLR